MQESGYEKKVICGGALISPKHILTAAVCVSGRRRTTQPAGLPSVRLGVVDLHSTGDDTRVINVDVKAIHRHPNFNVRTYNNDVALLELSKEVPFSEFVRPVCLPLGEISMKNLTGRRASVVGWGHPINVVAQV
ncbi:proclotting enzyme [Ixodes scapularis]|uniref:proclotting enzyme n=1 Tax=Ixodes scapularis TaxID=6945 RepID=UPI001A9F3D6A|nr:proclotting enzyme [Ixodes scapularis]